MFLTVNIEHFLKHGYLVNLCNGEVLCFLCGTGWILKYYLDEFRIQRVNDVGIYYDTNVWTQY
jgi:hypothetical protein